MICTVQALLFCEFHAISSPFSEKNAASLHCPSDQGRCVDGNGVELHDGVQIISVNFSSANGDVKQMGNLCLEACLSQTDVTGCMWHPGTKTCGTHSKKVDSGDDHSEFSCWVFSRCAHVDAGTSKNYLDNFDNWSLHIVSLYPVYKLSIEPKTTTKLS